MTASSPETALRETDAAIGHDIGESFGLPGSFYSPAFFAIERERLFPSSWCALTNASLLPEPGDVMPVELAGWQILLTRGRDGEIRAFHNVCRHRGIKLVQDCTHAARLTCPWHAWTYSLEGDLLAMPEIGGEKVNQAPGFDKDKLGLKPIRVGRWLDLVFVNIDGTAPPFAEWIAPLEALLADYDLSDLRHSERLQDTYRANWKIAMEAGIEDYHLPFGHPQLEAHLFRNTTACVHHPVYTGGYVDVRAGHAEDAETRAWTARLPDLKTHAGKPLPLLYSLTLFPTATVLITADHVMLGTLLPDGPEHTAMDISLYYHGDDATDPTLAEARQGNLDMWRGVIPQDKPFMEAAQATVATRDMAGIATRLSPYWEGGVRGFHKMVMDAVGPQPPTGTLEK